MLSVLIVGAGPTGLTLAAELARHGIHAHIIDHRKEPLITSNALAIQSRTLDIWQDMGIVQQALSQGNIIEGIQLFSSKHRLLTLKLNILKTQYPFVLSLPQAETESLLTQLLHNKYHINIERGLTCIDLIEHADHIEVICEKTDKRSTTFQCQWVIGCDGSHSTLRKLTHNEFIGKMLNQHFMMIDCEIDWELPNNMSSAFLANDGVMAVLPMKKHQRMIVDITHQQALQEKLELTLSDFQEIMDKRCYFPARLFNSQWISRFTISEKQVEMYRKGRIFFAGDAAHIHSPIGGQGLNTGIQDAHNLAWKLAFVLHGKAHETLLDTYHSERYPIAKDVLHSTTQATHVMTTNSYFLRWVRNSFFSSLRTLPLLRRRALEQLSEIKVHYTQGCLDSHYRQIKGFSVSAPKPGYRPINQPLKLSATNLSSLHQSIETSLFKLLIFTGKKPERTVANIATIVDAIKTRYSTQIALFCISSIDNYDAPWAIRIIHDEKMKTHRYFSCRAGGMYLLRPDNVVAFRNNLIVSDPLFSLLESYFIET